MSAYVVSDETISAILQGVYGKTYGGFNVWQCMTDPDSYHFVMGAGDSQQAEANELLQENIRSVNFRYKDKSRVNGVVCKLDRNAAPLPAITVLKLIDCLEYQSCEHPGWEKSEAYKMLNRFRKMMIPKLDGYDAAPWGL